MPDEDTLIKKRSGMKAKLTNFSNYISVISSCESLSDLQRIELESRLVKFDAIYDDFDELQTDLEILSKNPEDAYAERTKFEERFHSLSAQARMVLTRSTVPKHGDNGSVAGSGDHTTGRSIQNNFIRLPKIDLPIFNGSYQYWLEYRDTFLSLIHNSSSIDDISKLHYLRASLRGSAQEIIKNIDFKGDNYEMAWRLLCERYDNSRLLVNNHLQALVNAEPATKESSCSLRHHVDIINKNMRALNTLNEPTEHWDTIIVYLMANKLDAVTSRHWEEYRNTLSKSPTLLQFSTFLGNRADLLETLEHKQISNQLSKTEPKPRSFIIATTNKGNISQTKNQQARSKNKCPLCSNDHLLYTCETFRNLPVETRINKSKELNVCFNCLRLGHSAKQCKLSHCKYCKSKHNTLLHNDKPSPIHYQEPMPSASNSVALPIEVHGNASLSTCPPNNVVLSSDTASIQPATSSQILLSTALVKVLNSEGEKLDARILLDNGSTANFVTKMLCDRLRLSRQCTDSTVTARQSLTPHLPMEEEPKPAIIPKPPEIFKTEEISFEKPTFLPAKPIAIPHSPKISPSSIPNPSPSVSTNKPVETGFPNYGSYLYSIPGYSAFQPVSFPSSVQPNPVPVQAESPKPDVIPFPKVTSNESISDEKLIIDETPTPDEPKQQDFEEQFTTEIISAVPNIETHTKTQTESKMSITSLAQGSGATVTIPNHVNKDIKKKPERFSLKTSIPISKIDMKCVSNTVDTVSQNVVKKPVFNPAFQKENTERTKVEIQSNIVIKTATNESEVKEKPILTIQNNSISTLINAAEAISKSDNQFRVPEPKPDIATDIKKSVSLSSQSTVIRRPVFNQINFDKQNFPIEPPEGGYNEQKNQIVFIQNKAVTNPKVQNPQNPQVLLQRTNFDSKNLQAPSRLSNQSKKSKEDIVADNGTSSKVVALKRLHQDNCDENDFENLITENQIYGNKIVVKEKSQGTQQEQDLKIKNKDKQAQSETKNVVLQPSYEYVYVSNVQFPTNMMLKSNTKTCQSTDCQKTKVSPNENKTSEIDTTIANNNNGENTTNGAIKTSKTQNSANKEIHVLKSSNVLQSLSNNTNKKTDIILTTNQKVIVNTPLLYQVLTDSDDKSQIGKDVPKVIGAKKDTPKLLETKTNEKSMYIACQYKVDSKSQPKLLIANLRPKTTPKVEVISTLDIYERRKRLRRLKYLSNNNNTRDVPKLEPRKNTEKAIVANAKNIVTPDKMKAEIFKEFTSTKDKLNANNNDSESDYGEEELVEFNSIIDEYGPSNQNDKVEFLAGLRLATHDAYRDKDLEKQDRNIKHDSIATAYVTAGLLDRLIDEKLNHPTEDWAHPAPLEKENGMVLRSKQKFLSQLRLKHVSQRYKEAYENSWQEVMKERRRRNGTTNSQHDKSKPPETFDPNIHLQLLTEIKHSVNINNNLIKKRLDPSDVNSSDIRILAEKNFSELNRLSKMADTSVKLLSGQDTRKRDLNPGFDSENIKKRLFKIEPLKDYPKLNIPNIYKIVSLKSAQESTVVMTTQATSMDEPENSGSSAKTGEGREITSVVVRTADVGCQTGLDFLWPGIETFMNSYKKYEQERKKEIHDLHRRSTALSVESAHVTRAAVRDTERSRALHAERQHLAVEENNLRLSLQRLSRAIEVIRNC